jgi:hypothetical protein
MVEHLVPENSLEKILDDFRKEKITFEAFIKVFLKSDIAIPSASEVMPDGSGFTPLIFEKQAIPMLGVFTSKTRIILYKNLTPFCLTMKGSDLVARTPKNHGLVVNPGFDLGFEVSNTGLRKIVQDFGIQPKVS